MSREGSVLERDPAIRAAWDESFLGRIPGDDIRNDLLADAVVSTFAAGHLVQENDFRWMPEPNPITLVVEGVFRGYLGNPNGRQATVQYLRQGDTWGLVRALSEQPTFERRVHYQALVPSRAVLIRGSTFLSAARTHPLVALGLARELARILMLRTHALESSIFSDTATRVAQHIAELAFTDPSTGIPTVWLSQQEIADAVGTVREVVTRIIGQFRSRGIVRYTGRRLEILDMAGLVREGENY